jgi:hypothetical protein
VLNNAKNDTRLVQQLGTRRVAARAGEGSASTNAREMYRFKKAAADLRKSSVALGWGCFYFIWCAGKTF